MFKRPDMIGQKRFRGQQFKDFKADLETSENGGVFSGYGSVFDVVDSYNEIVAPGAFSKSLAELASSGAVLPVLWNHRSDEPIGKYTNLTEDSRGLKVEGELMVEAVARAKEVAALVDAGIVSGLSIGYFVKDYSYDEETNIITLTELKLREISIVTFPANGDARIETIKCKLATGATLSKREMEKLLRDAGLSKSQTIRMLRSGFDGYSGEGEPAEKQAKRLDALKDLCATFQTT